MNLDSGDLVESINCRICGRLLTAHKSVARGAGLRCSMSKYRYRISDGNTKYDTASKVKCFAETAVKFEGKDYAFYETPYGKVRKIGKISENRFYISEVYHKISLESFFPDTVEQEQESFTR